MWDLPGPGVKLVSLALQGRFLITGPPWKPHLLHLSLIILWDVLFSPTDKGGGWNSERFAEGFPVSKWQKQGWKWDFLSPPSLAFLPWYDSCSYFAPIIELWENLKQCVWEEGAARALPWPLHCYAAGPSHRAQTGLHRVLLAASGSSFFDWDSFIPFPLPPCLPTKHRNDPRNKMQALHQHKAKVRNWMPLLPKPGNSRDGFSWQGDFKLHIFQSG